MSISLIKLALSHEQAQTPEFSVFKILNVTPSPSGMLLDVQPKTARGNTPALDDEKLTNVKAWWAGKVNGTAVVKQITPHKNQIFIGDINGTPPSKNKDVLLYPQDYIKPLIACWDNDEWARQAFDCLKDLTNPKRIECAPLTGHQFKYLRPAQRQAFSLVNYSSAYLWGPPGTGKTTTLGAMLAEYLHANPFASVLLVSTTNRAVDEATIAVDRALANAKLPALRHTIQRYGSKFNQQKYEGRQHLLPKERRQITCFRYTNTPDAEIGLEPEADALDGVSSSSIRMRTMTITQAVRDMAKLKNLPHFDLLVFDEASQISLARALIVMPLGKVRLFAGDPMQLAPIVQSPSTPARLWLKRSVFNFQPADGPSICQLVEQSRMAPPICEIVSEAYYNYSLRVAQAELNNQQWLNDRKINFGHIAPNKHVHIQTIDTEAERTRESRGWFRQESAQWIVDIVHAAVYQQHVRQEDILILTPFRLQRARIQQAFTNSGWKGVRVSTVCSEQGAEASVVIFDPVSGCHEMSSGPEGQQSINVALSRAKSKLILTLSAADMTNPLFAQIRDIVGRQADRDIKPIAEVLSHPNYITGAVGERVYIDEQVGEITRFSSDGRLMWAVMEDLGVEVRFPTKNFRESPGSRKRILSDTP